MNSATERQPNINFGQLVSGYEDVWTYLHKQKSPIVSYLPGLMASPFFRQTTTYIPNDQFTEAEYHLERAKIALVGLTVAIDSQLIEPLLGKWSVIVSTASIAMIDKHLVGGAGFCQVLPAIQSEIGVNMTYHIDSDNPMKAIPQTFEQLSDNPSPVAIAQVKDYWRSHAIFVTKH